jgi:pyruvate/2-oxoglutarate dehydrogenase complex dihydrolipoamide dehydrogenase (E3) component
MVRHSGETERISARSIVIAAGARPAESPQLGRAFPRLASLLM